MPHHRFFSGLSALFAAFGLPALLLLSGCATTLAPSSNTSIASRLVGRPYATATDDPGTDARAKQLFVRGLTEAYLNRHAEAIAHFEEALRLTPGNAAIYSAIAASKEALGDFPAALLYAEQSRAQDPSNRHYHVQLAQLYLSSGDVPHAAETYETLLSRFPDDLEARYGLARVYTLAGRYDRAVEAYELLLEQNGEDPDLRAEILQLYVRQGDENGMERTLRQLVELAPAEGGFRRMLGELYLQQGRLADAVRIYQAAIEANPADFETALALAELYRKQGDPERADALLKEAMNPEGASVPLLLAQAASFYARAEQDPDAATAAARLLEQALEQEPRHADALVMLGDLRLRGGAYEEAAGLLYRALQENPRDPLLWHQSAAAYLQAGEAARAADVADEGLLLFPGQLPLLRISAFARMDANRNAGAIARFREALELLSEEAPQDDAQRSDLLAALGLLYHRVGDQAASDSSYRLAIEADPQNHLAMNNFAYSLAERGTDLQRALKLAERAVELDPNSASYFDTLGWIYYRLDEFEQAKVWIGKAVATGEASPAVIEHYGDVLYRLGEKTEARRHWQRALDLRPDDPALSEKLRNGNID